MGQRVRYLVTGGLIPLLALLLMLGYLTDGVESSSANNSPQLFAPFTKSMPEIDADRSNRPASEVDFSAAVQSANIVDSIQAPTATFTITLFKVDTSETGIGQARLLLNFQNKELLPASLFLHFWHPPSLQILDLTADGLLLPVPSPMERDPNRPNSL